jgi:hypothetical protein
VIRILKSRFVGAGQEGDFEWMIRPPRHARTLFVFNDNEDEFHEHLHGGAHVCMSGGADRNSKRMTSAEAVVIDREVAVRRGAPIRQAAPGGRRARRGMRARAVERALGERVGLLARAGSRARSVLGGVRVRATQAKSSCSRERAGAGRGGSVGSPRAAKDLAHDHRVGELCDEAARAAAEGAGQDVDGEDSSQ